MKKFLLWLCGERKGRKSYRIRKMLFVMEELTYDEDTALREIVKGKIGGVLQLDMNNMITLLDKLHEAGVIMDLFKIVVKPYNPTPFHWLWNKFWQLRSGISDGEAIRKMKNSEIAAVLYDFFTINLSWMTNWANSVQALSNPALTGMLTQTQTEAQ